ncbi:diaminopimelate epimerase [Alloprevotella tannerae]|uniref:Diaminopimelate epimerase n=1 Tax=Alloprevotella tannerae TaxID=76122 RepID=A0A929WX40_9BACT|nr:diaminopimelate epimerase [Alloprevotella tannerae]MBF0969715.1 diaminopimelate epimerase [Alloprevotella tannerae]
MAQRIEFTKMHGAGNDYIYIDTMRFPIANPEKLAIAWSDRHKGIGGDGIILIGKNESGHFTMRIFNNDGSEGKMCGNGIRCVGKYLYDNGITSEKELPIDTLSGTKLLHMTTDADNKVVEVTVDMGEPILADKHQLATPDGSMKDGEVTIGHTNYRGTFVSMGNPHFINFINGVEEYDVQTNGVRLEQAKIFPERCNIEFAEIRPDGSIRMRVWERGSGITMACGTGACATAVAAALTGRAGRTSTIVMDGGQLTIVWNENDNHIYMTGPATTVFTGTIELPEE